jgi:hypothetical protein
MRVNVYGYAVFAGVLTVAGVVASAQSGVQVFRVRDDCDPATFNAGPPAGPGAGVICNPNFDGDITFAEFIEELTADQEVGHWRFQPDEKELDRGQRTVIDSREAGEFHTFTRVGEFGGGILFGLNALTFGVEDAISGPGQTRPECGTSAIPPGPNSPPIDGELAPPSATNRFVPDGSVLEGPRAGSADLPRSSKWQCCIHPWMRSEVTVKSR